MTIIVFITMLIWASNFFCLDYHRRLKSQKLWDLFLFLSLKLWDLVGLKSLSFFFGQKIAQLNGLFPDRPVFPQFFFCRNRVSSVEVTKGPTWVQAVESGHKVKDAWAHWAFLYIDTHAQPIYSTSCNERWLANLTKKIKKTTRKILTNWTKWLAKWRKYAQTMNTAKRLLDWISIDSHGSECRFHQINKTFFFE